MAFSNDIVGGTVLLRPAIRSPNYIPGVSGWTINRDGSSEFASGTFRGPVIVIDPVTGNVLASIGANGNGSFQTVYAADDVIIGTLSVLAAITQAGRGVVGYFNTTGALPAAGGTAFAYTDTVWTSFQAEAGRTYRCAASGWVGQNPSSTSGRSIMSQLVIAQPGGFSGVLTRSASGMPGSDFGGGFSEGIFTPSASGPATVKLQCASDFNGSNIALTNVGDGVTIYVEDIGPQILGNGGTGTPSGATTFNKKYFATASQAYDSSFNSESDPNNMYTGQLAGRTHGSNENSLWCFPGSTIRSDISGAVINSAKMWMYCTGSDTANGSVSLAWMTNTTPPATIVSGGFDQHNHTNIWAGIPSWGFIDIAAYVATDIVSGLANSAYLQSDFLVGDASFFGAGNATFKPYLEINYTV